MTEIVETIRETWEPFDRDFFDDVKAAVSAAGGEWDVSPKDLELTAALWHRVDALEALVNGVAEQLRQVWNARGAADLAAIEAAHENYDWSEGEDGIRALHL